VVALQSVLFPAAARAQDDLASLRHAYLTVVSGVALVSFPAFGAVMLASETMVLALFGDAWREASAVLVPLAGAMIFHTVMAVAGPVLWGKGDVGRELKIQAIVAFALVATLVFASQYSIVAVAWGVFTVYLLRSGAMTAVLARQLKLGWPTTLEALRGGVIAGAAVVPVVLGVEMVLSDALPVVRVLFLATLPPLTVIVLGFFCPRLLLHRDLAAIVVRLAEGKGIGGMPWLRRVRAAALLPRGHG